MAGIALPYTIQDARLPSVGIPEPLPKSIDEVRLSRSVPQPTLTEASDSPVYSRVKFGGAQPLISQHAQNRPRLTRWKNQLSHDRPLRETETRVLWVALAD